METLNRRQTICGFATLFALGFGASLPALSAPQDQLEKALWPYTRKDLLAAIEALDQDRLNELGALLERLNFDLHMGKKLDLSSFEAFNRKVRERNEAEMIEYLPG